MKPKLITVLVVAVIVTAGVWLASEGNNQPAVDSTNTELAGEVAITLPQRPNQRALQPDHVPPDFYIIKENQPEQDNQADRPDQKDRDAQIEQANRASRQIVALSELKGRYVFINFWNTWCPPCREEMPDLNKLYLGYGQKNVEFLFINIASQEKSVADVETFLTDNNYSMPVYLDRRGEVSTAYGVPGVPATVIIDPQGQVVYAAGGPINYESAKTLLGF